MSHDFDPKHGGYGGPCDGKGIMSYGSMTYNTWSSCSKYDWEQHYASQRWGRYCLEDTSNAPGEFLPT